MSDIKKTEFPENRWMEQTFDNDGNEIYFINSDGYWEKREWENGKCIYFENSNGKIKDKAKMEEYYKFLETINKRYNIWDTF
jgi:hypothetical protein